MVELEEERTSLTHQLQLAVGRADSEALARSIAEETVAELEKEKTVKELEINDLISRHSAEVAEKDSALNAVSVEGYFWTILDVCFGANCSSCMNCVPVKISLEYVL